MLMTRNQTKPVLTHLEQTWEKFEATLLGLDGCVTPTGRHKAPWIEDRLTIQDLTLVVAQEGGGNFYEAASDCTRVTFAVGIPSPSPVRICGIEMDKTRLALVRPGDSIISSATDTCRWLALSIPIEGFLEASYRFDPRLS